MDVLELFLDGEAKLPAREITDRLRLPARQCTNSCTRWPAAAISPKSTVATIRWGLRLFQLGSAYAARIGVARDGQQAAEEVANRCDETVHVAVLDRAAPCVRVQRVSSLRAIGQDGPKSAIPLRRRPRAPDVYTD